jgi:coenzyme F420-reducing hydrogenase delta subunit
MDFFLSKLLSQTLKISQNSQEKNNFSQQFTNQINKITSLIPTSPTSRTLAMIAAYGPGGPLNHCSQARILESLCETMVEMLLILQQFEQGNDRIPQIA